MRNTCFSARWSFCSRCGMDYFQREPWARMCVKCYVNGKRGPTVEQQLSEARREVGVLRALVGEMAVRAHERAIPPEMLGRLIRLCHPDRHGGSAAANEVTAWLLAQRDRSAP